MIWIKKKERDLMKNIGKAFCKRAKLARSGDNTSLCMKACSRLNGGNTRETDGTFNTGCTYPVTTTQVVEDLKLELVK